VPGQATGIAVVSSGDGLTPTYNILLTARAAVSLDCHVDVSPAAVDFGAVPVNGFAEQSLVVVDDGLKDCTLSAFTLSGSSNFTLVSPPAVPVALPSNGVLTFKVHYQPTGQVADTGTLTVTESSGALDTVSVTGISTVDN